MIDPNIRPLGIFDCWGFQVSKVAGKPPFGDETEGIDETNIGGGELVDLGCNEGDEEWC